MRKLYEFIQNNNGDLLIQLEEAESVTEWIRERVDSLEDLPDVLLGQGKPAYVVEEICMEALTGDLRFSKYSCLLSVLETNFELEYYRWSEIGILRYEVVNLIQVCAPIFEAVPLKEENFEDEQLRAAISIKIQEYLEGK